jgi:hypothetical protein
MVSVLIVDQDNYLVKFHPVLARGFDLLLSACLDSILSHQQSQTALHILVVHR